MADLHRGTRWYEVRLSGREVSGIVAGSLFMLAITFALGVGFGRRLATPAVAPKPPPEHTASAADTTTPHNFTYQNELTKPDPPPPPPPPPVKVAQKTPPPAPPPAPPPVAVLPVPPVAPQPTPSPAQAQEKADGDRPVNPDEDQFAVQFRAFTNGGDAAALVHDLTGDGYDAYVKIVDIPKKGRFYRVRAGHFATRAAAEKFQKQAAMEHHLDSTVMPSN